MSDDRIVITREPTGGLARRVIYDPRDDGRWDYIEERWNGCKWVHVGTTVVDDVAISQPEAVA